MNADFIDRLNNESLGRWGELFDACAARLLDGPDRAAYVEWFLHRAPAAALPVPDGAPPARWYRALAIAMLEALPLPPEFRARRSARPGRNDPCSCGSGEKFKQCCGEFAKDVQLGDYDALEHVLTALAPPQYAALVRSHVDTRELAEIAGHWLEDEDFEAVIALLSPWFAPDTGKFTQAAAPLLMCYLDALLTIGRNAEADAVVALALERGDRALRGAATRARAYAHLDRGDIEAAWEDFAEVRRLTPSDPNNATLELTILIDSQRYADAQARARYWLPRLERNSDREADAPLEFVKRVIEDPENALDDASSPRAEYPELYILETWLEAAPPVASLPPAERTADGELVLVRDAALRRLETRWADVFPVRKPAGTDLLVANEEAWDHPEPWLEFLREEPAAWQSLEVLDDLVLAVSDVLGEGTSDPLLDALLRRGAALALAQLAPGGPVAGRLTWDLRENRPPLRLLAFRAARVAHDPAEPFMLPVFFSLCETLLALDPADHHGVRGLLAQGYLLRGEAARALALGEPHAADAFARLNHVLALYIAGRSEEAGAALAALSTELGDWLAMLRDEAPALPEAPAEEAEDDDDAAQERVLGAWTYRDRMRALWQTSGALDWLQTRLR
ncbi:MAG TPA: SEC-C metal-binding domain-containing protein [Gammaproteobacteria bacterium]|nr:SEC-C metal-binding domain-containing protein [Gammaproteobacteria bacterium]